jgi:putative PIG3 family NAD(P)H quinone oxidoreductase
MRAVGIKDGIGPAENLFVEQGVEAPVAKHGQALIRVKAFGLNRMDLIQRSRRYTLPKGASTILGVEFSGIVESLGSDTSEFKVGDRVCGLVPGGAYAEYVACDFRTLMKVPDDMSWAMAAGIPEVWFTATQTVKIVGGTMTKGQTLLFHAGASGVGIAAIQIAQLLGARKVYATVGSDEKCEFLRTKLCLGCSEPGAVVPINYKSEDFVAKIQEYEPNGVDRIVDPVGQAYFEKDLQVIALDGTLVVLGAMSGTTVNNVDLNYIRAKRMSICGTALRSQSPDYQKKLKEFVLETVIPGIQSGKLFHFVHQTFPFEKIVDAHKALESNSSMGKLIVEID